MVVTSESKRGIINRRRFKSISFCAKVIIHASFLCQIACAHCLGSDTASLRLQNSFNANASGTRLDFIIAAEETKRGLCCQNSVSAPTQESRAAKKESGRSGEQLVFVQRSFTFGEHENITKRQELLYVPLCVHWKVNASQASLGEKKRIKKAPRAECKNFSFQASLASGVPFIPVAIPMGNRTRAVNYIQTISQFIIHSKYLFGALKKHKK